MLCCQSGSSVGAGTGAAGALQAVLTRVVKARSGAGALVALRVLASLWEPQRAHDSAQPLDLHASLLRVAHDLVPSLASQHLHHAMPLIRSIGKS